MLGVLSQLLSQYKSSSRQVRVEGVCLQVLGGFCCGLLAFGSLPALVVPFTACKAPYNLLPAGH